MKLPTVKPIDAIRALERAGFLFVRQRGSHRIYTKTDRVVVLPFHTKDMKPGTLRHIIKQSGLTVDEFAAFL